MTPEQIKLVQDSWQKVELIAEQAADIFYSTLFEMDPSVKLLFKGDIKQQGEKLMNMIGAAVGLLDRTEQLIPVVQKLGERHGGYGVIADHYDTVGEALLDTLDAGLGDDFTDDVRAAWAEVYGILAKTMIDAADNLTTSHSKGSETNTTRTEGNTMSNSANDNADFFQGALEQSGTANVMIDRDFIITYANQATLDLLKKHEATFQIKYPGFSADAEKLLGTCIDDFHKDPAHQRKLLKDPNNLPWKADIDIEHLKFELNVTAITDAAGNYIGNSLEWQDVTQVRAQENKAARLQGAVDQSGTAQVMIDRDFIITYANPATLDLLKKNEATFQIKYPGFSADAEKLLGTCIDGFHKDPAHQRKLLDDPNNLPWKTDIEIEHLKFELNVTAVLDAA
ncbi:MAG: globin domain-containing protein, partial [Pseudomonadales bacterium]